MLAKENEFATFTLHRCTMIATNQVPLLSLKTNFPCSDKPIVPDPQQRRISSTVKILRLVGISQCSEIEFRKLYATLNWVVQYTVGKYS